MKRGKKIVIIFILFLITFFIIRLYIDHNVIRKTSYEITSSKIPKDFNDYKILHLSDLHSKNFGNQLLNKIDAENPDIIVLTGDMVSACEVNYTVFLNFAKKISEKYKVYYIKGNHEGKLSKENYNVLKDALSLYGVEILDNEKAILKKGDSFINLYGMWCNQRYYSRADIDKEYVIKKETVTKILGEANKNEYNILLTHTPTYYESYEAWGADLVLAGHIHAGLIRIPFLGGVFSPDRKLFPKYCYGKYDIKDSSMIISAGLSRGSTGFRFLNRPEIVTVILNNK